ncbi:MAG: hypothetical protein JWP89_3877 [Schlesneria sp.]|nr:hypothetical protein [Schlesneria sp.]
MMTGLRRRAICGLHHQGVILSSVRVAILNSTLRRMLDKAMNAVKR